MKIFFITYLMVLEYVFIKSKYKGNNSVKKQKGDSPLKHGPDCTCANTDYSLHGFDVCD